MEEQEICQIAGHKIFRKITKHDVIFTVEYYLDTWMHESNTAWFLPETPESSNVEYFDTRDYYVEFALRKKPTFEYEFPVMVQP